ncbi:macoilin-like [Branchiostoma floridae]|uniref:Macoilin n=1 Tax=Branchiostoma floridae TaxID=7739 RepID=A0A9J7MYF1_BRAFL|nr:macoilin-like [Branchiostoma floridae]XP_035686118.1 macoilin-like [Branchiostoma floridae]
MMQKRRNADIGKLRRPLKRNKITESIYGSTTFLYLKFLLVWGLVMLADFILEFRFEYLWPFWLLLRSVYDSFKYQGLAFSVFFVCVAFTSDMICLLFIPVHWLFFAASTYVWVQYVWHTERGICLPTVSLWLLFVYIEASVRLKDLGKGFHVDLCRPFAAHCIGYPMVTLGFGVKSYISYRMRLRKQKDVAKENEFYMQLLQQALPPEMQQKNIYSGNDTKALPAAKSGDEVVANGGPKKLADKKLPNGDIDEDELEYMENSLKRSNHSDYGGSRENLSDGKNKPGSGSSTPQNKVKNGSVVKDATSQAQKAKKNVGKSDQKGADVTASSLHASVDKTAKLESDMKRLKADLQASRQMELDLRSHINSLMQEDRITKSELSQLRMDNESLQSKLHNLVTARQKDKENLIATEKKLRAEQENKAALEKQLRDERKKKQAEEMAAARALAAAAANASRGECTEACKQRHRELETEVKKLRHNLKQRDDQLATAELEKKSMRNKESQQDTEVLMSALNAMQDKNTHLESSLSAETRLKLDLFSALGDVKRQQEIAQAQLMQKEQEVKELKMKIAELMALTPASADSTITGLAPSSFSPKFRLGQSSDDPPSPQQLSPGGVLGLSQNSLGNSLAHLHSQMSSSLDPNAAIYTPKSQH